ncbi:MAG: hypothetical protein CMO55_01660 [Verrucomicrobiales bacterium]|nr:hypothetical protein [Verrucomicrobiales bacterium]
MKRIRIAITSLVALLVLGGAGFISFILIKTAPKTEPEEEKQAAKIVRVTELVPTHEKIEVDAWGTVIPAREVTMRPQVGGRVVEQHEALEPGGKFKEGDLLAKIDPSDYKLDIIERKSDLTEAEFEFELEQGRQKIAQREWEQLRADLPDSDVDPSLALREPQLRRTQAMIDKAQSSIDRAELDLSRTEVMAPFNGMVIEENVEIGQLLDAGDDICRLVGTDTFWVQATLPMADLKRIRLPENGEDGAHAEIHLDTGNGEIEPWEGKVVRLLPNLEETGRMARILVAVEDPLGLLSEDRPPLLLGSYVRVEIEAGRLEGVLSIPRVALREGNRLWMVGPDNRIRIAEPEVLWTRPNTVLVPDIREEGERLIISELKAAPPGMEVNPQPLEQEKKSTDS